MRTTLTLDDALLRQAKKTAAQRHLPLKKVINDALRLGLEKLGDVQPSKYSLKPRAMGLRPGINLDKIAYVLEVAEGEGFR
jgi:hypothetical protein